MDLNFLKFSKKLFKKTSSDFIVYLRSISKDTAIVAVSNLMVSTMEDVR